MTDFQVGDRVRCVNNSPYRGLEGTVRCVSGNYSIGVEWDGKSGVAGGYGQGGYWSSPSLERIDLQAELDALTEHYAEVLAQKNAALKVASFVFGQYAENHFAKGTPESTMKAITNVGLEGMMLDALEAD